MSLPRTPSFGLDGRRALVTGASRGIGLACAAALAQAGAHVTLAARSAAALEDAAAAFRAAGWDADALPLDVTDISAVAAAVDGSDPFDILLNNAGLARHSLVTETTPEDYDAAMAVNVRAAFFTTQAVARRLIAAGRPGAIINVSSQMGHVGGPTRAVYCATKHAMEGMTKAMALDLGPHGIRINTIGPTFVETELTRGSLSDPTFRAWVLSKIALGRLGTVEDVMGPVVFLASDAARLITGTSLLIDGGWTAA
jgi:NAD(P)-dependent dehydrogenase (short-subunit alcohol dehydrogenase family)